MRSEIQYTKKLDINKLIVGAVDFLKPIISNPLINIQNNLAPDLPLVTADKIQIEQVLVNLLLNAAESCEDERQTEIDIHTCINSDKYVLIEIIDTGSGIKEDIKQNIFEPFYTSKPNGLGMGLSISRTIIENHHDKIWAETNPTGGTVLKVLLPTTQSN